MNDPVVSVILTTQLDENSNYLSLALLGLSRTVGIDFEVFVMAGTETEPRAPELKDPRFRLIWDPRLDTATKKIDAAFKHVSTFSTHILHISDDVIVSKYTLKEMYDGFSGKELIMNPLSNSDCRSLYLTDMKLESGKILTHDMSIEDLSDGDLSELLDIECKQRILVPFQCVSFYCTMIPKTVYVKVGFLDSRLEYRCNDQDYCLRAAQKGIATSVNFGAFAFHFGSKTLRKLDEDKKKGDDALKYFYSKWKIN